MPIDNTTGILSSAEQAQSNYEKHKDKYVDATEELVNSETFMQLLVAEMTNQDPLEPTSNTEFISQLATFSQMQYARDSSKYSMANYAASLVGKTATASKMDGKNLITKTGVVESVTENKSKNSYMVKIDGETFDLSKVTAVTETVKSDTDTDSTIGAINSQNALGDSIARASGMVGMYASVSKKDGEVTTNDSGFITAIQVKDGVISAVINDKVYALSDITEVTYATVVDGEENNGSEGTKPTENVQQNGSGSTENSGSASTKPSENVQQNGSGGTENSGSASTKSSENVQQNVVNDIDEDAVLQTGAIVPDYEENDVADLVDESDFSQAVQQVNMTSMTEEGEKAAEIELAKKLIAALESGADIETVLKIAGEIPADAVITNPHPTGIRPVSAPSSAGIASAELSNEKVDETVMESALKTETANSTDSTAAEKEADRILAQKLLDAMAAGADLDTLLRMGGVIPETDEES